MTVPSGEPPSLKVNAIMEHQGKNFHKSKAIRANEERERDEQETDRQTEKNIYKISNTTHMNTSK